MRRASGSAPPRDGLPSARRSGEPRATAAARSALLLARALALPLVLLLSVRAGAQTPARFSVESSVSVDKFGGDNAVNRPQIIVDINAAVRLGRGWTIYIRPWFRQPRTPDWDKQIYQAAFRYERPGRIAARVDAGYIASPVGLGMLDTSPSVNPTIATHMNYVLPMLPFNPGGPRAMPIAATYPLSVELAVSSDRWDARAALVNSTPTRIQVIGGATHPRATPVVEAGAGITPRTGLRIGVSVARGEYLTAEELTPAASSGRELTMVGIEGEYAFGYTKISGEMIRDAFATTGDTAIARAWFVQGIQTLSPRWFVAARQEGTAAPILATGAAFAARSTLQTAEATLGFRITPDITVHGGYFGRKFYRPAWDHQIGASIVWARRWW